MTETDGGNRGMRRTRRRALAAVIAASALGLAAGTAAAQEGSGAEAIADPGDPDYVLGGGVRLGPGVTMHPLARISTGYQSNVFRQDANEIGAGIMRIGVGANVATDGYRADASAEEGAPRLAFQGDVDLTWNQYLSDDDRVMSHSRLGVGALADLQLNPRGPATLQIKDGFSRIVRPPQAITAEDVARIRNDLTIAGMFRPGYGAMQARASYTFGVDLFERDELSFANRQSHLFGVGGHWQWLPRTRFTGDVGFGFVLPSEETVLKSASMPLRITAGVSTLITPTFGVILKAGYGNSFHAAGPSFSSYLAQAEGRVAIGPLVRAALGYSHDFHDSVVANFYAEHSIYGRLGMVVGHRLDLRLRAALKFRGYEYGGDVLEFRGLTFCGDVACTTSDRDDVLFNLDLTADYPLNPWLKLGAAYSFTGITTDFHTFDPVTGNVRNSGYLWHELLVRASARF
jgi:hypothetical protein